jgi:hypothetical protein
MGFEKLDLHNNSTYSICAVKVSDKVVIDTCPGPDKRMPINAVVRILELPRSSICNFGRVLVDKTKASLWLRPLVGHRLSSPCLLMVGI